MSSPSARTITSPSSRIHVRQFTTTTVFADPTSLGSHAEPHAPVPIAAIAGGACGGVVLAVLVVIGWKWWGQEIKKKERRELEKRKAMGYRAGTRSGRGSTSTTRRARASTSTSGSRASSHSPSGTRSRRTSFDPASDRTLKRPGTGTGTGTSTSTRSGSPVPPVPPLPPLDSISPPRPLKPRSAPAEKEMIAAVRRDAGTRLGSNATPLGNRTRRPLRPSPLPLAQKGLGLGGSPSPPSPSKLSYSPRTTDSVLPHAPGHPDLAEKKSANTPYTPVTASAMIAQHVPTHSPSSPPPPPSSSVPPPSSFVRLPRIKASPQSLSADARRQSKASSHNSASDQSRHSSAGGSARRWSWWSLINGRGFRQIGPTTGKNRISADTSVIYSEWQEEDPAAPIGYAYSGVGVDNDDEENGNDQQSRGQPLTGQSMNAYVALDSDARERCAC